MTFESPWCLLLLAPLAILLAFQWRRKEPSLTIPDLRACRMVLHGRTRLSPAKLLPFLCFTAAAILAVAALARPRSGIEKLRSTAEGIDIMLVFDISGSMLSLDLPIGISETRLREKLENGELKNRLDTAKEEIAKFIQARPGDRIGLIQFATGPDIVCPPTLDHPYLLAKLSALKPEPALLGTMTGISAPIVEAADSLKKAGSKNGIIVLFTDGKDNVPAPLTPNAAAENAKNLGFRVYTVGIGSKNAFAPGEDFFGRTVLQRILDEFDEPLLHNMASLSGGRYYRAADPSGMAHAMKEIDSLEKTGTEHTILIHAKEWYPLLAFAAMGFILLGAAIANLFLPRLP